MAYSQIKDILKRGVEFHKLLADFYVKVKDDSKKDSVKLLADYMARHEKTLESLLSQVGKEQEKQITEEWIKYEPGFATYNCFDDINVNKNSGVDEIIDAGLTLNQCLIDLYHQTAEVGPTEEIKTLFSSLENAEIAEKKKLARMRGM
jgi:rubrerythrin